MKTYADHDRSAAPVGVTDPGVSGNERGLHDPSETAEPNEIEQVRGEPRWDREQRYLHLTYEDVAGAITR